MTFVGANPRQSLVHAASSNAKLSGGHVSVQQKVGALKWRTVANDCSLSTRLYWKVLFNTQCSCRDAVMPAAWISGC